MDDVDQKEKKLNLLLERVALRIKLVQDQSEQRLSGCNWPKLKIDIRQNLYWLQLIER